MKDNTGNDYRSLDEIANDYLKASREVKLLKSDLKNMITQSEHTAEIDELTSKLKILKNIRNDELEDIEAVRKKIEDLKENIATLEAIMLYKIKHSQVPLFENGEQVYEYSINNDKFKVADRLVFIKNGAVKK